MTGKMPQEGVNPDELQPIASHIWQWFLQLNQSRQNGINGPSALSSTELHAFFQLEGYTPEWWELQAIRALDSVAMASVGEG